MRKTPNVIAVLGALRDLDAPFGMEVARHTGLHDETVYRVLARLRDEQWVTVHDERMVRRYELTPLGASWAEAWTRPVGETVTRVRRKGGEVNVIRWSGTNWDAIHVFCGDVVRRDGDTLWLRTVDDNEESCVLGWWIVEGVRNKYPIPPDVFNATYELP
jgi:hypothetical protein